MRLRLSLLIVSTLALAGSAWAQSLAGRLYPEKQEYLVQEPVVVVLDLTNNGSRMVTVDDSNSCGFAASFEVPNAEPVGHTGLWGCSGGGYAGSCLGDLIELRPGQHLERRYLLKGPFLLVYPGLYQVRAFWSTQVYEGNQAVGEEKVASEFVISLEPGTPSELEVAYEPFLRALESPDYAVRGLAIEAVTQNSPPFLEPVILRLADDPQTAAASIPGLERLATPSAKAKLAELTDGKFPEWVRERATEALGELGDPAYCQLMLDLARGSPPLPQSPLLAAGRLCGPRAIPLLFEFLARADSSQRFAAACALGNTSSRGAVPALIALLADADPEVRRAAADALATLTHRRSTASTRDEQSARRALFDWAGWWSLHSLTAPVYSPADCALAEPID